MLVKNESEEVSPSVTSWQALNGLQQLEAEMR